MILSSNVPEVPKVNSLISTTTRVSQIYWFLFLSVLTWKVCNRASREIKIWKLTTLNRDRILPCFKEYSELYYFSCIYFTQESFLLNGKDIKYRINKIYGLTLYILCICIYILRLAWQSKHSTKSKWTSRQDINSSPRMKES